MWETWVQSLGWEDPLEKGKATTPISWTGEFHGLYSLWGHKESDTTEPFSLNIDYSAIIKHNTLRKDLVWKGKTDCHRSSLGLHFLYMFTWYLKINKVFSCKNSLSSQTKSSEVGSMGYFLSQLQSPSLHRDTTATGRNRPQWTGGFPGGSDGKESACDEGDLCLILGLGRSPGGGHGNPFQYSCLENSMDRGTWRATIYGVAKSRTWLCDRAQHPPVSWSLAAAPPVLPTLHGLLHFTPHSCLLMNRLDLIPDHTCPWTVSKCLLFPQTTALCHLLLPAQPPLHLSPPPCSFLTTWKKQRP